MIDGWTPEAQGWFQRGRYWVGAGGEVSRDFYAVLPRELTVKRFPNPNIFMETLTGPNYMERVLDGAHGSPFLEVGMMPYWCIERDDVRQMLESPKRKRIPYVSRRRYANFMVEALGEAIMKAWVPSKFHIVTHSSGYDTRLISYVLKGLEEQLGSRWLGQVVFLEADGEAKRTRELLKLEGWGDTPFHVYNEGAGPGMYHARSINPGNILKRFNGVSGYPLNVWYEPIEWLQEQGIAPKDSEIQCITGYGSNEIATAFNRFLGLPWYFEWIYSHALSNFRLKGEWVHVFYDLDFLKALQSTRGPWYHKCGLSKAVVKELWPESMNVPNTPVSERNKTIKLLHPSVMRDAVAWYRKTWYGSRVAPWVYPGSNLVEYSQFWGHWCLAAICESLTQKGHWIRAEESR